MALPGTDVARRFFAAWNASDLDGVLDTFDPDGEFRPLFGALVTAPRYRGHDGIATLFHDLKAEWEEYRLEPEQLLADGERIVAIVRLVARRGGGGPELEARAAYVCTLRDGRLLVVEGRDAEETLERLGA